MIYEYEIRFNAEEKRYEVFRKGQRTSMVYVSPREADCEKYVRQSRDIDRYHEQRMGRA